MIETVFRIDAVEDDDERPGGPANAHRKPPNAEMMKPPMTAVKMPAWGVAPEAMAKAIASGRATIPTVNPAMTSAAKSCRE